MEGVVYARRGPGRVSFWPYRCVAMIRDEGTGRLEITSVDGDVGHCAADIASFEEGPWFRAAPGVLIHPAHARSEAGELVLPGGWRIEFSGTLPAAKPVPRALIPGTQIAKDDVLYVRATKNRSALWITDHDKVSAHCPVMKAAAMHGDIVRLSNRYLNRRRVRSLRPFGQDFIVLTLDTGEELQISGCAGESVRRALGLPASRKEDAALSSYVRTLFRLRVRDYPFDLSQASSETLRAEFGTDVTRLMYNVLWQTFRRRKEGRALDVGRSQRAFWYRPLLPMLMRAGLVGDGPDQMAKADLYRRFLVACANMAGRDRLFTYGDLGFEDRRSDLRGIGTIHPSIVILCEKVSLVPFVRRLSERLGVSWLISQGISKLFGSELLAADLREAGVQSVTIIAYVDYDPAGWVIASAFADQLSRYGMPTDRLLHVVTPDRFTRDELQKLWHPLEGEGGQDTRIKAWMKVTGGIGGRQRGMYSNHLVPYERVEQAVCELSGLSPMKKPLE